MYFLRLIAVGVVAAGLIAAVLRPVAVTDSVTRAAAGMAAAGPSSTPFQARTCPVARPVFAGGFADIADVISVSPLGGVTAPGEPLPAPYIRINTRSGASALTRRTTAVVSPARAEITAIERRIVRAVSDDAAEQPDARQVWTVHFAVCEDVSFYVDDLDAINPEIMRRVGGVAALTEIGGPDHAALAAQVRVRPGDVIGEADGFDIGLEDRRAPAADLVRPERYRSNPYVTARVRGVDPVLVAAVARDHTRAKCPLDYLPEKAAAEWSSLLGDSFGMRKVGACRTALQDAPGTAQGAWYTNAAHNAVASKESAVALAPDAINPKRQIFALHGRLRSLTPDMVALTPKQLVARAAAAKDFLTFDAAGVANSTNVNTPFAGTKTGGVYCYEGLRANFVGPRINGVLLLSLLEAADGPAQMRMEARADAVSCAELETPWAFTGAETTFYR